MADIKISDMTSGTAFAGSSYLPMVESGSNKKIAASDFFANIQDPVVINSASENNDTVIKGQTDAQLIYVDASANRVGFSKSTPATLVDIDGDLTINGPVYNASANTQSVSGSIDLSTSTTVIDSSSAVAAQIGGGLNGQVKTIVRKGSGSVTITTTNTIVGGSTIALNVIGSSVVLQYIGSAWYIVGGYNSTLS